MNTGTNWYELQRDTVIKTRPWKYTRSLHRKYSGEPHTISHSKSSCEILRTICQPKKGVFTPYSSSKTICSRQFNKLPLFSSILFNGWSTCWMVYFNIQQHTIQYSSLLEHVDPYVIGARVIGNLHNCLIYLLPFLISVNVIAILPNSPYCHEHTFWNTGDLEVKKHCLTLIICCQTVEPVNYQTALTKKIRCRFPQPFRVCHINSRGCLY